MKRLEKKTKELLTKAKHVEELKEHEKIDKALAKLSLEELRELLDENTTDERSNTILEKVGLL